MVKTFLFLEPYYKMGAILLLLMALSAFPLCCEANPCDSFLLWSDASRGLLCFTAFLNCFCAEMLSWIIPL